MLRSTATSVLSIKTDRRLDAPVIMDKRKYFDPKFNKTAVRVLPGDYYITNEDEMLVTVLGSCVTACIRDPKTGFGGMNHFMLPSSEDGKWGKTAAAMRYGNHAMETLINELLKSGCAKNELEIKVFGGGNVSSSKVKIGTQNGKFVLNYLQHEELDHEAADLGGPYARRIHFFPATGIVQRLLLRRKGDTALLNDEAAYEKRIRSQPVQGEIELFEKD
ncbi:MAG: hypothetical protein V7750_14495 [Sneathiella sp.]